MFFVVAKVSIFPDIVGITFVVTVDVAVVLVLGIVSDVAVFTIFADSCAVVHHIPGNLNNIIQ